MDTALQRISVVGNTGSGKTSMAAALSRVLGLRHVELDSLHRGPGWTPRKDFADRVAAAVAGDAWVTNGNYSTVRGIVFERVQLVIWLDYPLWIFLYRLTRRIFGHLWRKEVLWNGNTESWRDHFASRDSLFIWAVTTYSGRCRRYRGIMKDPHYAHIRFLWFRSPRRAGEWFEASGKTAEEPFDTAASPPTQDRW